MDSDTDSAQKKEQDEQVGDSKKQSKKKSKSKQKKAGKGKAKAAKKPKEKQKKQDKEPKKKKASKSKDKGANFQKDLQTVKQYMQKQNRPYNLLNIFDNLHGSIKKPALQAVLDKLAAMEVLTCKEFGKNKVYFLNQSRFEINEEIIDKLTADLTVAREQNSQLQIKHKALTDEYKKLMSMMTETQLQNEIEKTKIQLEKLEIKKQKLTSGAGSKIDEATVIKAEKQQQKLRRQLKKFRGIKKDALNTWSEILEKKPAEVAEIMGLD